MDSGRLFLIPIRSEEHLKERDNIILLTHQLSALENKPSNSKSSSLLLNILDILFYQQQNNKNVTLLRIPTHKSIVGNEMVDKLVEQAAESGFSINYSHRLHPYTR